MHRARASAAGHLLPAPLVHFHNFQTLTRRIGQSFNRRAKARVAREFKRTRADVLENILHYHCKLLTIRLWALK